MDGKQLKNSILQWAIQGKLVPQNPKDEPAQKLLERIAASRNGDEPCHPERSAKGTKSKDLKKKTSKNPPSRIYRESGVWYEQVGTATPKDISDEIPFEIPENWVWCRFFQVVHIASNLVDSSKYLSFKHIAPDNIEKGSGKLFACKTVAEDKVISNNHLFKKGQIIYSKIRPLLRKCVIAPFEGLCSADMYPLESSIDNSYVMQILLSDMFNKQVAEICASRVKMPKINQEELSRILMPLPPLAEQKRIVAKLEQVLPLAEEYGAAQEQLDKLNKELPEALKKSILQEAIQGKLVPQNPKDEPASVLLAKIRKEKEALVKQGKLKKKDLESTQINEEEIPFELPMGWVWARFEDLSLDSADGPFGSNLKKEHYTDKKEVRIIQLSNIGEDGWRDLNTKYTSFEHLKNISRSEAFPGDIIVAKMMPAGRAIICPDMDKKYVLSSDAVRFDFSNLLHKKYLYWAINSTVVKDQVYSEVQGITRVRTSLSKLRTYLIPVPPLAEQKRIVTKLEQLFKVL